MVTERTAESKWWRIARSATHLRGAASSGLIIDLALCQDIPEVESTQAGCVEKCVVSVFLDEPTPGSSKIYLELIVSHIKQVELKFYDRPDVGVVESRNDLYDDKRTCEKLIRSFKRLGSQTHSQPVAGMEEEIEGVICTVASPGVSQDDQHSSRILQFPGQHKYEATWLTWTETGHKSIVGNSPVPLAFRVRTDNILVNDMYFWVFLPRRYRQSGEECLVHDGVAPFDAPIGDNNPVFSGRIDRGFPVFKEWSSIAFGKLVVRNKDAIAIRGSQNALLSLRAVSDELDAFARRQSLMAGVSLSLGVSIFANLIFGFKTLDTWATMALATVSLFLICLGWREYRRS